MKNIIIISFFLSFAMSICAQNKLLDSFNLLINKATSDTQRINLKLEKFKLLGNGNFDSAIVFGINLINETKKINYKYGEAMAEIRLAGDYNFTGQFVLSKKNLDAAKDIFLNINDFGWAYKNV